MGRHWFIVSLATTNLVAVAQACEQRPYPGPSSSAKFVKRGTLEIADQARQQRHARTARLRGMGRLSMHRVATPEDLALYDTLFDGCCKPCLSGHGAFSVVSGRLVAQSVELNSCQTIGCNSSLQVPSLDSIVGGARNANCRHSWWPMPPARIVGLNLGMRPQPVESEEHVVNRQVRAGATNSD